MDSTGDNAILLNIILKAVNAKFQSSHRALHDVSKTFDSVSYSTIMVALRSIGFSENFILYLEEHYKTASTLLVNWRKMGAKYYYTQGRPIFTNYIQYN